MNTTQANLEKLNNAIARAQASKAQDKTQAIVDRTKKLLSTWFATTTMLDGCDTKTINEKCSLSSTEANGNAVGQAVLSGKRGGANRIWVFLAKDKSTGVIVVSVRYGHNMPYFDEVFTMSQDFTKHAQDAPKDGRDEAKIRFTPQRFYDWLQRLEAIHAQAQDNTTEAEAVESVTA